MAGPFANPNYNPTPPPGQEFWGGMPQPHTQAYGEGAYIGHGHNGHDPRLPVADFLGNVALRGAGVDVHNQPRWSGR